MLHSLMIWPLPLTNLQCPCLELISNELSGWIFCCVRRVLAILSQLLWKQEMPSRYDLSMWQGASHTALIPSLWKFQRHSQHSEWEQEVDHPLHNAAVQGWAADATQQSTGEKSKLHRRRLKRNSEKDKSLFPDLLLTLLNKLWHYYSLGCANRAMG